MKFPKLQGRKMDAYGPNYNEVYAMRVLGNVSLGLLSTLIDLDNLASSYFYAN